MRLLPKFGLYRRGRLWYNNRVIGAVGSIEAVGCHGGYLENNSAFFASTLARGLSPRISHGFRVKGLPMVKKKIILLLAALAVLALGISYYFFRGRDVYRISERGLELKEAVGLLDFHGSTDRYTWSCPTSVVVSNQAFKLEGIKTEAIWKSESFFSFYLSGQDGSRVASCTIDVASSDERALDLICDRMMFGCTAPTAATISDLSVKRDAQGNVIFQSLDRNKNGGGLTLRHRWVFRTYGNLAVNVTVFHRACSTSAKDFAQALIEAGASRR